MKALLLLIVLVASLATICSAKEKSGDIMRSSGLTKSEFQEAVLYCQGERPKVWQAMESIRGQGVDIAITGDRKGGPGKTIGKDKIVISSWFFANDRPGFPEDRLVVVLFHEFGHILYTRSTPGSKRTPVGQEIAAFGSSLELAKKLAENGDAGPLRQALYHLRKRRDIGRPRDPHTIALQQLVGSGLWQECEVLIGRSGSEGKADAKHSH